MKDEVLFWLIFLTTCQLIGKSEYSTGGSMDLYRIAINENLS